MKTVFIALASILGMIVASLLLVGPATPAPAPQKAASPQQSGQAKITWSTQALTFFLLPGDIRVKTVSFTDGELLSQVSIEAVPEISPFLKLTPAAISALPANTTGTLQIQASLPPSLSSSSFNGTIHVRQGSRTIPQPLSVVITVGVPPDPGAVGKATLAGIDSDGDGVRDDVQRYIGLTYPQSAKTRASLTQAAMAFEAEVVTGGQNSAQQVHNAQDCMSSLFMTDAADVDGAKAWADAESSLKALVLNTPARTQAFFQADSALGPGFIRSTPYEERRALCTFNASALPN